MKPVKIDMHTHTLASGHAYSTVHEMITQAEKIGLEMIGITEHGPKIPGSCDPFYFFNTRVIPRFQHNVKIMIGAEMNILDYKGTLDLMPNHIKHLDLRIAGIHFDCYTPGSIDENTCAIINAIKNKEVDIISHPDDGNCPLDYSAVVDAAKEYHTILEINNNALRSPSRTNVATNQKTILTLCQKANIPVILSSDAHYISDLGNIDHIEPIIDNMNFPDNLILNYHPDQFEQFILENVRNRNTKNVYFSTFM